MLTGLDPETTGIFNNSKYRPVPEGYTIFERVQKLLGKDGIATILVSAKTDNVGSRTPEEIAKSKKGVKADAVVGDPYSLTKKTLDVCDSTDRLAAETGTVFLKYLEQYKTRRFLAFVHFADPDKMGHKYGSASKEYRQGAIDCDAELGKIVEWLKKEKRYDTTRIYVTADHGFDVNAKSHTNAPHISLATNDKQVTHGGTQADIPTTILQGFGVDLEKLNPKVIGKPLTAAVAK